MNRRLTIVKSETKFEDRRHPKIVQRSFWILEVHFNTIAGKPKILAKHICIVHLPSLP